MIFRNLATERQCITMPVEPIWEMVLEEWKKQTHQGKSFFSGSNVYLTNKSEKVRSKSEKIIADFLDANSIDYKYEKPLYFEDSGYIYPDFTFLNPITLKEMFWEHFGMMDSPDYALKAIRKIESYQKNGIFIGERLIVSFEGNSHILNQETLKILVDKYLLLNS